jgi:Mitochondrial pyruvate carriers
MNENGAENDMILVLGVQRKLQVYPTVFVSNPFLSNGCIPNIYQILLFLPFTVYDAFQQGPEIISLTMTPVLMVYSFLFVRWSLVIAPKNYFLAACHATNIVAQGNQLRRALEYKMASGQEQQVHDMMQQAGLAGACLAGSVVAGPTIRSALSSANLGVVSTVAAADAGPFTVHFWAPMSKWLISGASFFDLNRPTDKISLAQYTALTLTGFFFSRYSLLVKPINYVLCSVNIALFGSSAWHLGRKINADYIAPPTTEAAAVALAEEGE